MATKTLAIIAFPAMLLAGCASGTGTGSSYPQMQGFAPAYSPGQVGVGGFVAPMGPSKNVSDLPSGYTEAQFHRDNLDCVQVAHPVVGERFSIGSPAFVASATAADAQAGMEASAQCMLGKGYTRHKE